MKIVLDPNSMDSYRDFLRIKSLPFYRFHGHVAEFPDEYANIVMGGSKSKRKRYRAPEWMYDYQGAITEMSIAKKKFSTFVCPGYGKTGIFLEFIRYAMTQLPKSKRGLIVSPLMVIKQTMAECERFFGSAIPLVRIEAKNLRGWLLGEGKDRIGITNYDALEDDLPQGCLGALALDECFAKGTKVDVCDENGVSSQCGIENIRTGDRIWNAYGIDTVIGVKRREVSYAYAITAGKRITCSPNHLFFTRRGWVAAQDLGPRDSVLLSRAAMRMVQRTVPAHAVGSLGDGAVLRSILLSEMAHESADSQSKSSHERDSRQDRQIEVAMVERWQQDGARAVGADRCLEPDVTSGSAGESFADTQGDESQTFRAWWQREGLDGSSEDYAGCVGAELAGGVCVIAGKANSGISNKLQARLGERRRKSLYRGGWKQSLFPKGSGHQEGCESDFVRVESVEVLEQGHPELERLREADGKLYFYDIECERHPSFSVNGLLVHNSSMMKSAYGKWAMTVLALGRGLEWKIACTGTPAPNDRIEYANHAVFMDAFPNVNSFLARFFVNRGQTQERWEMRPHALEAFYRALSHWSIFMTNPATYGWKDNAETIPKINVHIHDVDLSQDQRNAVYAKTNKLFVDSVGGITKRSTLAQIGKGFVGGVEIESFKPAFIKGLIDSWPTKSTLLWCHYNQEQDQLAKVFPDAANIDGSTPYPERERIIDDFKAGRVRTLISKPRLLGFGLNLQVVTKQVFSSLQDSYEEYYQAVKRSNRVGSTEDLDVHIPITEVERPMVDNVLRKAAMIQRDTEEQERIFKANALLAI